MCAALSPLTFDQPAIYKTSWHVGDRSHLYASMHNAYERNKTCLLYFATPRGLHLEPPASEGRSLPTGLWVQLPSGPFVPPLVSLLSHLASAVGKAP